MSNGPNKLSRKELKGIIDLEEVPSNRYDYQVVVLIARILYRVQLTLFNKNTLEEWETESIIHRELKQYHGSKNITSSKLTNDRPKCLNEQFTEEFCLLLAHSKYPLQNIESILTTQIATFKKSTKYEKIRQIYSNMRTLARDIISTMNSQLPNEDLHSLELKNPSNNRNNDGLGSFDLKKPFSQLITFADVECLNFESSGSDILQPPLPLCWLGILTNGQIFSRSEVSCFKLRNKEGDSKGTIYRSQLIRMKLVQTIYKTSKGMLIENRKKSKGNVAEIPEDEPSDHKTSFPDSNISLEQDLHANVNQFPLKILIPIPIYPPNFARPNLRHIQDPPLPKLRDLGPPVYNFSKGQFSNDNQTSCFRRLKRFHPYEN
ncbi:hypothetical protein G9A89_010227 [Geosiphon pyriformis]|nr:hypothetical protein G9A89_010227 [Geosiphon pyriformis]